MTQNSCKKVEDDRKPTTIYISSQLRIDLKRLALDLGTSLSALVEEAITKLIKEKRLK